MSNLSYPSIYEEIYNYCSIKQRSARHNGFQITPRVNRIIEILNELNIYYIHKIYDNKSGNGVIHNIICPGSSSLMLTAHHDITGASEGANDNSASVINMIAVKMLNPNINIAFLDGEEVGGEGSECMSDEINYSDENCFENIESILNLELTGKGGKRFFIENIRQYSDIKNLIMNMSEFKGKKGISVPEVDTPFNDSVIFRSNDIDAITINPLPPKINFEFRYHMFNEKVVFTDGVELDTSILSLCNGSRDTIDTISTSDMREFVEEVLLPITIEWDKTH